MRAALVCRGYSFSTKSLLLQDAGAAAASTVSQKQEGGPVNSIQDGSFTDYRWKDGRWDLSFFTGRDNKIDWDAVGSASEEA